MGRHLSRAGLWEAGSNLALAAFLAAFAFAHLDAYRSHHRPSVILIVVMELTAAVLFVLRRAPRAVSSSPWAIATTLTGTFLPLLVRPSDVERDWLAGQVVQVVGVCLVIAGLLSLRRSLGLLPANRGIRTGGMYRWVRHPLYAAYIVANGGYLVSNLTAWNVVVLVAGTAAQVLRLRAEEAFLASDPEYASYARRTRWRLLPFVY